MTTIKITELTDIGANLASSTVLPVVNMSGTPTTQKTVLGNIANVILGGAGGNYVAVGAATLAGTVTTNAQPNITSTGSLTGLTVSNAAGTVNFSNTANVTLGAVGNLHIAGGTAGQLLSTNGNGTLSWASDTTTYGNSNVVTLLSGFGSNTITTTGNIGAGNVNLSGNIIGTNTIEIDNRASGNGADINLYSADDILIQARDRDIGSTAEGGDINIFAGDSAEDSDTSGGDITIEAGRGGASNIDYGGTGGFVSVSAGQGGNAVGANFVARPGGSLTLNAGDAGANNGNIDLGNTGGDVTINAGDSTGNGDLGGSITLNGGISANGYGGQVNMTGGSGELEGGSASLQGGFSANGQGGAVQIAGGGGNSQAAYGNVEIGSGTYAWLFDNTGNVRLPGNTFAVNYANGTQVSIGGGANTGNVTFSDVTVQGVNQLNLSWDPLATANLAYLQVRGGDVASHIHLDTGNNNAYDLIVGNDDKFVQVSSTGNIIMSSYDGNTSYTWTLDTTGNLILAGGNSVIQSIANSSLDPNNANVSTMVFTPDALLSSQSLVLDPTGPSHIHLRAPSANIDEPDANIFLGGEASSFEVGYYNGNVPNLYIHSNNNTWTFDTTGNLTLPLGSIVYETNIPDGALSGSAIALKPIGGTTANQQLLIYPTAADGDHIHMTSGNLYATELFLGSDNLYVKLANTGNVVINSNDGNSSNAMWTFDTDGNLTLPGNLVINGLTNVFGSNVALLQSNPDLPLLSVSSGSNGGVSSLWVEDIGNVGTSNIAAVYANPTSGSGIVRIAVGQNGGNAGPNLWDFNANGTLTFPGTPRIDTSTNNFEVQAAEAINFEANAVVNIYTDAGNNAFQWQFGDDGNLTLPGDIIGTANANFTIYSNAAAHEFIFGDDGTFYAPDNVVLGGNSIYIGPGANALSGIEHEVFIASSNLFPYVQAVVNNVSDNGSADWVALGAKGGDAGGQTSLGFTSSGFGDANYTITGNGDGYVLVQSYAPGQTLLGGGGNLVLATGNQGTTKDIIFGTGGFLSSNIFGRISHANNSLELSRAGATITFPDATEQNTAWTGSVTTIANGNSNVNIATSNGNIVITSAGTNSWNFDSTGNLTIPGSSGGFIKTVANASIGVAAVDNGTNNPAQLISMTNAGAATSIVSAYATNATIQTNATGTLNTWQFDNTGNLTAPGTVSATTFTGNGGGLSNVATKVAGSWTLASGNNTVNISVPLNGTYSIWVNGNIPNGIITYTATAVVTNTNVPVLGSQYAWYYSVGNALVFTTIPDQFTGTVGSISNVNTYLGNTANVFTFGITNNSGNTAVVNYGYTKL